MKRMRWLTSLMIGFASLTGLSATLPAPWFGTWEASPAGLPVGAKLGAHTLPPRTTAPFAACGSFRSQRGGWWQPPSGFAAGVRYVGTIET